MGAGGNDINTAIRGCIPSDGFWRDLPAGMQNILAADGGLPHLDSGAGGDASDPKPTVAIVTDLPYLICAPASSSKFYLDVNMPIELAQQFPSASTTAPFQALRVGIGLMMVKSGGSLVDTPLVTCTAKVITAAGVVKATYTGTYLAPTSGAAPTSAAVANETPSLEYWWEFTGKLASSVPIGAGDRVVFKFAVATHTTDSLVITTARARAKLNASNNAIQGTGNSDR